MRCAGEKTIFCPLIVSEIGRAGIGGERSNVLLQVEKS